jgi:hypothetical protein
MIIKITQPTENLVHNFSKYYSRFWISVPGLQTVNMEALIAYFDAKIHANTD